MASIQTPCRQFRVAVAGNPNTGKTTLFNRLTGFRQRVGNYPGVTVEKKTGFLRSGAPDARIELIDLPGAYSLAAQSGEEGVVLDVLLGHQEGTDAPEVIVVVLDATNLARNLFLASQILEIGRPVVGALNMVDLAEAEGLKIDADVLSRELGIPIVPVVATSGRGIEALARAIEKSVELPAPTFRPTFPVSIQRELNGLTNWLKANGDHTAGPSNPVELLQALLVPGGYHETRLTQRVGPSLRQQLLAGRARISEAGESLAEVEGQIRYESIERICKKAVVRVRAAHSPKTEVVDRWLTHRLFGLVVLLVLMAACFQAIYQWSGPLMDAIDGAFAALGGLMAAVIPEGALQSLLVDGGVAGVGAVLTFLPQILVLFLFIAILEDVGYMARAALLLDRWMGLVGLNGQSFIPLLSSFACAIPGILATRVIEDRRDRLLTILIAPLMSCSARLPVYTLLISAFIPATPLLGGLIGLQAMVLLAMYLVGVVLAVGVAVVLKKTLLPGRPQPFLIELPTYKWPSPSTVVHRVWQQGKEFCVSAGTVIFAVAVIVWALGYYPRPAAIGSQYAVQRAEAQRAHQGRVAEIVASNEHLPGTGEPTFDSGVAGTPDEMSAVEREFAETIATIDRMEAGAYLRQSMLGRAGKWIGPIVRPLGWDWRIGTAVIASFPAREVVLATMGTIYNLGADQDETSSGLRATLHRVTWPDGRPVMNVAVALSLMVFFALCCQCGATLAVIKRETNSWRWPLFTFGYMTSVAYAAALVTYQIAIRFV